jgi:hypothetical protein
MTDMAFSVPSDGKFSGEDVAELRADLVQSGLDSWQTAELISKFLCARGYGASACDVRDTLSRIAASHCSLENIHQELEQLALVM